VKSVKLSEGVPVHLKIRNSLRYWDWLGCWFRNCFTLRVCIFVNLP